MLGFGGFALLQLGMMLPDLSSLEYLGGASGSGSASITASNLPARDVLILMGRVPVFAAAADLYLRFNGDTAANYWGRSFSSADVIGAATFSNTETVSATSIQMDVAGAVPARHILAIIQNRLATTKMVSGQVTVDSGATNAVSPIQISGGEWVNTTAQITSITLTTAATVVFGAGSAFGVFGRNIQ